ncbi:MAG: glutamine-hydrolyzing carbamoyl-phosphate synthase small subunit [bacterium]|nr:glutamine-hydrolyzing carbamoyl-phosphate synthase small subunit [bacterium]
MNLHNHPGGYLLFEDNTLFPGDALIGASECTGEAVFNTSHSGYQEILSDPSYRRQIMVFTCPHIGNVGMNTLDMESDRIQVSGLVVRNLSPQARNWRSESELAAALESAQIPALIGADTRSITLHIRDRGAMRSGIFTTETPIEKARSIVLQSPDMSGADLASAVTCQRSSHIAPFSYESKWKGRLDQGVKLHVAVMDFGVKRNIIQELNRRGCEITTLPAATTAQEILDGNYNGVLLSNGPGDPAAVTYAIDTIADLIGKIPIFGICLGHQLLALAAGYKTFKLPFGHRGANHPVRREQDKVIEITSQNHGFAVENSAIDAEWQITHVNLNDGTVEGLRHKTLPVFSVQYHPEASPGPHDSLNYFDAFIQEMIHAQAK